jgi:hypothetical protein
MSRDGGWRVIVCATVLLFSGCYQVHRDEPPGRCGPSSDLGPSDTAALEDIAAFETDDGDGGLPADLVDAETAHLASLVR